MRSRYKRVCPSVHPSVRLPFFFQIAEIDKSEKSNTCKSDRILQIFLCNSILVPHFRRIFVRTNLLYQYPHSTSPFLTRSISLCRHGESQRRHHPVSDAAAFSVSRRLFRHSFSVSRQFFRRAVGIVLRLAFAYCRRIIGGDGTSSIIRVVFSSHHGRCQLFGGQLLLFLFLLLLL